jgi:hypothetical protein
MYMNLYVVNVNTDVTCVNLDVYGTCRCFAIYSPCRYELCAGIWCQLTGEFFSQLLSILN